MYWRHIHYCLLVEVLCKKKIINNNKTNILTDICCTPYIRYLTRRRPNLGLITLYSSTYYYNPSSAFLINYPSFILQKQLIPIYSCVN